MSFAEKLLAWYQLHGRHNLPWQVRNNPYPVWVSEIMLQQTQVATVIPYFERFLRQFPDINSLASADLDQVLHLWTGLGYYARARNLHKTAQVLVTDYDGRFPRDLEQLVQLPGIGRSTAGAILAQSYDQRHPILDGNVKRVLSRYRQVDGWPGQRRTEDKLWALSDEYTPETQVADYTQAIMDLGATVCTRTNPNCEECPINDDCQAYIKNVVTAYPQKRPSKQIPVKTTAFLLLKNHLGEIYLEQRPPAGIWGGLWCLPELTPDANSRWDLERLPLSINTGKKQPVKRHSFSHYHLDYTVLPATVKGDQALNMMEHTPAVWYNPANPPALGLAAPIKKLLHSIEVKHGENG